MPCEAALLTDIGRVVAAAPFRHMITPGGRPLSATITNCGSAGWISDHSGYRYTRIDPHSGHPWPALPESCSTLARRAAEAAGFAGFAPDACLINCYAPGARMIFHGVAPVAEGLHPGLGRQRINLTLRRAWPT